METKIEYYLEKTIQYNYYAVLLVLFYLEEIEEYEECQVVLRALRRYISIYDTEYPTTKKGYLSEEIAIYIKEESEDYKSYILSELKF